MKSNLPTSWESAKKLFITKARLSGYKRVQSFTLTGLGSNFIFLLIYWPYWKKVTPKIHNSHAYKALLFQLSRTQITLLLSHFLISPAESKFLGGSFFGSNLSRIGAKSTKVLHSFNNSCANPRTLLLSAAQETFITLYPLGARRRRKQQRRMIHGHYCRYYFNAPVSHL